MAFTFIHTADWQIGKPFGQFAPEKAAVLRRARLDVVDRIAAAARSVGAADVLVAGDVFDSETPPDALVRELLARLAANGGLTWHLISGNHDPARAGGAWDSVRAARPPASVKLHLTPAPVEIAAGVLLLPAPLRAKSTTSDPTAWMDAAVTPAGALRIGIAHGSIRGFGSLGEAAVPIDPRRPEAAGLAYLALGDWHGAKAIGPRAWYSGTPEPDGFVDNDPGHVLAVRLDGPRAEPRIERHSTAEFRWLTRNIACHAAADLDSLRAEIGGLGVAAARTLLSMTLEGRIGLAALGGLEARLADLAACLFAVRIDRAGLATEAGPADLATLDDPALAAVAGRLAARANDASAPDSRIARLALERLALLAAPVADDGQ